MNLYQDLEDSLYNIVAGMHPDWTIIFAYTNVGEPVNPYLVIDVRKLTPIGREYSSTPLQGDGERLLETTMQDHIATVRFEFIGKYDNQATVSEMAQSLQVELRSPKGYELQSLNRVALHNTSSLRRLPLPRDTDIYMIYQLDCDFAYTASITTEQEYATALKGSGVYHDANEPPDYTIETQFEVTLPT